MVEVSALDTLMQEVELFIQYGVQEEEQVTARALLHRYEKDALALQVMREFYSSLPDTHEEAIARIAFVRKKEDVFLLAVSTARYAYLYMATVSKALLIGEYGRDGLTPETLSFFGCDPGQDIATLFPVVASLEEYEPLNAPGSRFCPVCTAAEGEPHLLGCPVEICPWCDGQLSRCGCRFEQLGVEEFTDETELEQLERLLREKGRIPYERSQRPFYPVEFQEQVADEGDAE